MNSAYKPNYVLAPGVTLLEMLEERGWTQAELAHRMSRPIKTINEIVKGKASITPETALQLERTLGASASFWLNNERRYREHLAREHEGHLWPTRRLAERTTGQKDERPGLDSGGSHGWGTRS